MNNAPVGPLERLVGFALNQDMHEVLPEGEARSNLQLNERVKEALRFGKKLLAGQDLACMMHQAGASGKIKKLVALEKPNRELA